MNDSYFPHDSNARNSDKLIPVRMKYGAEGYGIYFMILERLREEKNYMSIKDYNTLAFDLRVDTSKIKAIVEDFGLFAFTENSECFYSKGFNKRMEIKDAKSRKRSEAGKKGASKRWQKNSNATEMPSDENSKTENANAIATEKNSKESKGKETKEKENKEENTRKYSDEHFQLAKILKNNLSDAFPKEMSKVDLDKWANTIRLMIERDERTIESIAYVINWLPTNDFWFGNIRSAEKLRKQFEKLTFEIKKEKSNKKQSAYRPNVRREPLPAWLNNPPEEKKLDPAKKAEIERRFAEYEKWKKEGKK